MGRRRKIRSENGSPADAFVSGTPIDDDTEMPAEDVEISREEALKVPLDSESARIAKQHRDVMSRKAKGETGVRWHPDARIRYHEAVTLHPSSNVAIRQISPYEGDGVPSRPVALLKDYDLLIKYIKESWNGEHAQYKWTIGDVFQPQWATGIVHLAPDESRLGTNMKNPQTGQLMYGVPVHNPMQPMHQVYTQPYVQPQYAQQSIPQYVQPTPYVQQPIQQPMLNQNPISGDPMAQLVTQISELTRANANLAEQVRQLQQYQAQNFHPVAIQGQMPMQAPMQVSMQGVPVPGYGVQGNLEPQKPMTPLQAAKEAVETVVQINRLTNDVKNTLVPETDPKETEYDDFPIKTKDIGGLRWGAIDNQVIKGSEFWAMNTDRIFSVARELGKEFKDLLMERRNQITEEEKSRSEQRRAAIADAERLATIQERIARAETLQASAREAIAASTISSQVKEAEIQTISDNSLVDQASEQPNAD